MKTPLLFLIHVISIGLAMAQGYHMTGTWVWRNPPFSGIDSTTIVFTATDYKYYINGASSPASEGTYEIQIVSPGFDSLILNETSGACINNGGSNPIKFRCAKTTGAQLYLEIFETGNSIKRCPTHSNKIIGLYETSDGQFVKTQQLASPKSCNIYPNPAVNFVQFKTNFSYNSIKVFNLTGKEMQCYSSSNSPLEFQFENGMYYLVFYDEKNIPIFNSPLMVRKI